MNNTDILRRLRYAFDFNNSTMREIFSLCDKTLSNAELERLLDKEDPTECDEPTLCQFLDGLITYKRGPQDNSKKSSENTFELDNNLIIRKLKIALQYDSEEMITVFGHARFAMSSSQLSSLFRSKNHRNYKECSDSMLTVFIKGLTTHLREAKEEKPASTFTFTNNGLKKK